MDLIPITERLPEAEVNVLIYNAVGYYAVGYVNKNGHWAANINGRETEVSMTTHWAPLPELPKKKRWRIGARENGYYISDEGLVVPCVGGEEGMINPVYDQMCFLGVYRTVEEAEAMRAAIKAFITEKIGEV